MLKLITGEDFMRRRLNGLCGCFELVIYADSFMAKCTTHWTSKLAGPECIECLCQSAEMLHAEYTSTNSP